MMTMLMKDAIINTNTMMTMTRVKTMMNTIMGKNITASRPDRKRNCMESNQLEIMRLGIVNNSRRLLRLAPPLKLWRHVVAKLQRSKAGYQLPGLKFKAQKTLRAVFLATGNRKLATATLITWWL
jgi:hypothetical protein